LRTQTVIIFIILSLIGTSCDNKTEIIDSKKNSNQDTRKIEEEKDKYETAIDSLDKEILALSNTKNVLKNKKEFAEAEIISIVKESYLDHVIIGSNNLDQSRSFLKDKLGFSLKKGTEHSNGISSFFVEFEDSSEIELISVANANDKLTEEYNSLLAKKRFGFQFVLRTNKIYKLKEYFRTLDSRFSQINENKTYSTLSKQNLDPELPLFFIQYHQQNVNTVTNHQNKTLGISSVWISTREIKSTAMQYIDLGFSVVDRINVGNIKNKTVLLRNDNFEIILIESNSNEVSGLTIRTSDLNEIRNLIKKNLSLDLKEQTNKRGKSLFLNPKVTNSIWFEFLEKSN
jgi:Glyoxalase-like domain